MVQNSLTTTPVLTITTPGHENQQVDIVQTESSTAFIPKSASNVSISPTNYLSPTLNRTTATAQSSRSSPPSLLSPQDNASSVTIADDEVSEGKSSSIDDLRRHYEDEQIDRFLRVFHRVHEVNIPQALVPESPEKKSSILHVPAPPTSTLQPLSDADDDSEEWRLDNDQDPSSNPTITEVISQTVSSPKQAVNTAAIVVADATTQAVQTIKEQSSNTYTLLHQGHWYGRSPAEYIAMELLVPYLPTHHRRTYEFTSSGIQQTASRLYLAVQPLYAPFMMRMWSLMAWEDPRGSFIYCLLFWILWFYDLLLPALMARLCYALVRRKVFPYPTKKELLEHKDAAHRADVMGADIRAYLDAKGTGSVGLKDAWKVFRLATKNKKQRAKEIVNVDDESAEPDEETIQEEENNKRALVTILEEVADLHERFANLCHWRRPTASRRYATILFLMIFVTMYTPPKYILKGIYAIAGILFWFIPTIIMAIPTEHRCRIPQPLSDVPTDAEYAMDIISQRVERGEEVLPSKFRKKAKKPASINEVASPTRSTFSLGPVIPFQSKDRLGRLDKPDKSMTSVTTVGDVEDANIVENGGADGSKIKKLQQIVKGVILPDQSKRQESLDDQGNPLPEETFPAKYGPLMGMISLTPAALIFYPMLSSNAKVTIPLQDVRNVKKAGRMGGIKVKYVVREDGIMSPRMSIDDKASIGGTALERVTSNTSNASHVSHISRASVNEKGVTVTANGEVLKEEKFGWVSNRDVLFAKLVGWGGRRWVKI